MHFTMRIMIDLWPISECLAATFRSVPLTPATAIDIVVRAWELSEIEPVEYYDELRSVIYDELHNNPRLRHTLMSNQPHADSLDQLSELTFVKLHELLVQMRPLLAAALNPYRITELAEYSITCITLKQFSLTMQLVRSDKLADYYRSNMDELNKSLSGTSHGTLVGGLLGNITNR